MGLFRPTAIDKKNWLFVGHPQAGERAAILYSILISCLRLDINPTDYLKDVLSIDTRVLDEDQRTALTLARWKTSSTT
jgi:transposase